eukprot:359948-Chlamydomonas_euryale.AAC.1
MSTSNQISGGAPGSRRGRRSRHALVSMPPPMLTTLQGIRRGGPVRGWLVEIRSLLPPRPHYLQEAAHQGKASPRPCPYSPLPATATTRPPAVQRRPPPAVQRSLLPLAASSWCTAEPPPCLPTPAAPRNTHKHTHPTPPLYTFTPAAPRRRAPPPPLPPARTQHRHRAVARAASLSWRLPRRRRTPRRTAASARARATPPPPRRLVSGSVCVWKG